MNLRYFLVNLRYFLELNGRHVGTFETKAALLRHVRECYRKQSGLKMYIYDGSILQSVEGLGTDEE